MSVQPAPARGIVIAARAGHYVRVISAVDSALVTFRLADPGHKLSGVRLRQDAGLTGTLDFRPDAQGWELAVNRPPVARMEYLLELHRADGSTELVLDPANPLRVEGAFGQKSVLQFPGYRAPAWLSAPAEPGVSRETELHARSLGAPISVRTWAPADAADDEPLPLLVVHDGPEYDALASLTRYLAAGLRGGWLPRLRAALLAPGPRDRWYSANPNYARAFRSTVIPEVAAQFATTARVGMGASLGALAMLHVHCRYPGAFDALFLQSGSFFTANFDGQERRFAQYRRIVAFVASVHAGGLPRRAVPVTLTCGTVEENLANNKLMTRTLQEHGYRAVLNEIPDAHNYSAWRDAFDPYLTRLLGGLG